MISIFTYHLQIKIINSLQITLNNTLFLFISDDNQTKNKPR